MTETNHRRTSALRTTLALAMLAALAWARPALAQTTASGHVALKGTYIEVGVNKDGYFGIPRAELPAGYHWHSDGSNGHGFVADYRKNGFTGQYGGDYFTPGNPYEGFYVGWTGASTIVRGNFGPSTVQIPSLSLVNTSSGTTHSAVWTGEVASGSEKVKVIQTYSFKDGDLFFTANVQLINTGTATLNAVKFVRQVDPDNDVSWTGSYNTANVVVNQPPNASSQALVTATGTGVTDMTLGLGAIDSRAKVSAQASRGSPDSILLTPVSSISADVDIGLAFALGTLAPGQSVSFDYAYILSASDLNTALGALAAVTIQQPTGTISGTSVPFQVTTNDVAHTTQVDFYVGGSLIGSSTTPVGGVFSTSFNSTGYANGSLALKAVATINGTLVEKSSTVVVDNSGPPMAFTTPANGGVVSGDGIAVAVSGTDAANPPTQVVFYREVAGKPTVTLATVNAAPFQTTFNTSDLSAGTAVTLRAVGRNAGGQTTNITVGVSTATSTATSLTLGSSQEPATAADAVHFTATLSPSAATGTVQFRVDGVNLGTPVAVSGGTATSTAAGIHAAGAHAISAAFTGSGTYLGSTGSMTQHVTAAAPATVVVSAGDGQTATVGDAAFPGAITVTVEDAWGNPVPSASVAFLPPGSGASATVDLPSATTDSLGQVTVHAAPNTVAGSYAIDVVSGAAAGTIALTNAAGAVSTLVAVGGADQSATVGDEAFGAALGVLALDAYGNPVPGVTVEFSAPGSGASAVLSPASATTAADGVATVAAGPNTAAGTYLVTAAAGAVTTTLRLTNLPGAPWALLADAGATPQQAQVGGAAFTVALGVTVRDAYGNAVPGVAVAYAAPGSGASASLSAGSATTDATGHAEAAASAGTTAGAYQVVASTSNGRTVGFDLTNLPGAPVAVQALSGGGQHASVEASYAADLVAAVADEYGNAVPGALVAFATPGSGASVTLSANALPTDSSGQVRVSATPNTVAGALSVTATVSGIETPATFALTNDPGVPASIAADETAASQTAVVDGAFGLPLQVTVRDQYGNTVPGATVTFTAPEASPTAVLSGSAATTDGAGVAAVTATAGAGAGQYSVIATIPGGASATFSLTNSAGAPAQIQVVSGSGAHATVATAFVGALVVSVTDSHGNPVPAAQVTFAAPQGGASAALSAVTVSTAADGRASVTATAGTVAGGYHVSATCPGTASPAVFSLSNDPGVPATVTASPLSAVQTAQVGTAFAPLVVVVQDAYGNPVPGVTVTFGGPAAGAGAALGAAAAVTGDDGIASVTAAANTVSGGYTISASVDGVSMPAAFSLTNQVGPPGSIAVVSGNAQSATVATAFAEPLLVVVRDAYGNAVPGVTVAFAAPGSGASAALSAATADTGADGQASVGATAGTVAGAYQVTATVPGVSTPVQLTLTNLAGEPASLVADASATPQSARVGEAFASPLGLAVLDAHGNPVPGRTVSFACPAAAVTCSLDASAGVADASGHVSVVATAGERPGAVSVVAQLGSLSLTFQLANLVGPPGSIAITGGAAQQATVFDAYSEPLAVVVKDAFGNAVPGAEVSFEVTSTGAQSAILGATSAVTDADGFASVTATANGSQGAFVVRASVPGAASPAEFSLENVALVTTLATDIQLPVFGSVIRGDGITHLRVRVGPNAGELAPTGTVRFLASRTIRPVEGQAGVAQDGEAIVATLVDGAVDVEVQVVGWRSRTLRVDYAPDEAAAGTWDPVTTTVDLTADVQDQQHGGGGCSSGADGTGPLAVMPLLVLGLGLRRRRR